MKKQWDFWLIVGFMIANMGILITIVGFMLSMNARMATKNDLARVEADITDLKSELKSDIKEIRALLMNHIINGHKGHTHKKSAQSGIK